MSLIFAKFNDDENPLLLTQEIISKMEFFDHSNELARSSVLSDDDEKIKVDYILHSLNIDKNTFSKIIKLISNSKKFIIDKNIFLMMEYLQVKEGIIQRILDDNKLSGDFLEHFEQQDLSKRKQYYKYLSSNDKYKLYLDILKLVVTDYKCYPSETTFFVEPHKHLDCNFNDKFSDSKIRNFFSGSRKYPKKTSRTIDDEDVLSDNDEDVLSDNDDYVSSEEDENVTYEGEPIKTIKTLKKKYNLNDQYYIPKLDIDDGIRFMLNNKSNNLISLRLMEYSNYSDYVLCENHIGSDNRIIKSDTCSIHHFGKNVLVINHFGTIYLVSCPIDNKQEYSSVKQIILSKDSKYDEKLLPNVQKYDFYQIHQVTTITQKQGIMNIVTSSSDHFYITADIFFAIPS
mgnify:CR=1 FL=1